MNIQWGQCVPDACTEEDIVANYNSLYEEFGAQVTLAQVTSVESQEAIKDLSGGWTIAAM